MKTIKPRHIIPSGICISSHSVVQAKVWYYRREKRNEIVVEVRSRDCSHIATVQFNLRHPITEAEDSKTEAMRVCEQASAGD